MLDNARTNTTLDAHAFPPNRQAEVIRLRIDAAAFVASLRPVLFPADDDE